MFKRWTEKKQAKKFNKTQEKIVEDVAALKDNIVTAKTLCAMATSETVVAKLKEILDLLQYASPSKNPDVAKFDDKIGNKLDDVKILVSGGKVEEKILEKINDTRILIVERNSMTESGV